MKTLNIREKILESIKNNKCSAVIKTDMEGILAGKDECLKEILNLDLKYEFYFSNSDSINKGDIVCTLWGYVENIIKAEEIVIGKMAKTSGIATATKEAVKLADGKVKIVAGAWKKMPIEIKSIIQNAVKTGGASTRLVDGVFIYLDKNLIRMFGGIKKALMATPEINNCKVVVQLKGEEGSIEEETITSIENGADIVMVDTGNKKDLIEARKTIERYYPKKSILLGFAGDLKLSLIPEYADLGANYLCIGKQIIDAPLLDMKLDVVSN